MFLIIIWYMMWSYVFTAWVLTTRRQYRACVYVVRAFKFLLCWPWKIEIGGRMAPLRRPSFWNKGPTIFDADWLQNINIFVCYLLTIMQNRTLQCRSTQCISAHHFHCYQLLFQTGIECNSLTWPVRVCLSPGVKNFESVNSSGFTKAVQ